jgi:TetR/AcrR family transcriptional regulator, mexJK operon transcriptional repressor
MLAETDRPAATDSPKRRQVLEAAAELFLAHGYGPVSMDAVARAAGVSKATLYAHFSSKDELFGQLMRERAKSKMIDEALLVPSPDGLREALETLGRGMLRYLLSEQTLAIYRIAIAESQRFPELGRAFHASGPQRGCDWLRAWVLRQQEAGLLRPADPTVAAEQLASLLRSNLFLRATLALGPAATDAEIDASVAAAVDTWLRAYAAEPPPA